MLQMSYKIMTMVSLDYFPDHDSDGGPLLCSNNNLGGDDGDPVGYVYDLTFISTRPCEGEGGQRKKVT
jgi:hypothetical protein